MLSKWRLEHVTARTVAQRRAKFLYWFNQLNTGDEVYIQTLKGNHVEAVHRVDRIQRSERLDDCKVWIGGRCYGVEQFEKRPNVWAPQTIWTVWSRTAHKINKSRAARNFGRLMLQTAAASASMSEEALREIAQVISKHADPKLRQLCNTVLGAEAEQVRVSCSASDLTELVQAGGCEPGQSGEDTDEQESALDLIMRLATPGTV